MGIKAMSSVDIVLTLETSFQQVDSCYTPSAETMKDTALVCIDHMIRTACPSGYATPIQRSVMTPGERINAAAKNMRLLFHLKNS